MALSILYVGSLFDALERGTGLDRARALESLGQTSRGDGGS